MAAGIAAVAIDPAHTGFSTTMDLNSSGSTADEEAVINAALNVWASVAQFTNLGKVADGGVVTGAPQTAAPGTGGDDGDIRIGAYNFPAPVNGGFTLAHAYQPRTEAQFGTGGTTAGDIHFNNFANGPAGVSWFVDATSTTGIGALQFDFFTVALHELGHALGLGHSAVAGAVMEPVYAGIRRTLSADDIAGIQAIYGAAVPEPSSFLFFVLVAGIMSAPLIKRMGKVWLASHS
jgi:hypothetical protein